MTKSENNGEDEPPQKQPLSNAPKLRVDTSAPKLFPPQQSQNTSSDRMNVPIPAMITSKLQPPLEQDVSRKSEDLRRAKYLTTPKKKDDNNPSEQDDTLIKKKKNVASCWTTTTWVLTWWAPSFMLRAFGNYIFQMISHH